MKAMVSTLGVALALALPAAGQTIDGRERARAALPSAVFEQVEQIAAAAARDGLPVRPLWDKALEGGAKRVPADRIAPALAEYAARLGTARGALGTDLPAGAIVAGADALQRGVPAPALARVREGARTPMVLVVLADLVEAGVPVDRAVDVVRVALEQRAADEDMLALAGRVRAAMRQGQTPGAAADGLRRALREGRVRRIPPGADPARPPTRPAPEPVTRGR